MNIAAKVAQQQPRARVVQRLAIAKLVNTIVQMVIGGAIVFAIGVFLGRIGAS